jgi:hypothetical protein
MERQMTDRRVETEAEKNVRELTHDLQQQLASLAGTCRTTEDLAAVIGTIAQANTFLARAASAAVSSFARGCVPPSLGERYSASLLAAKDVDRIDSVHAAFADGEGIGPSLRQLLHLQSAVSYAGAYAHGAVCAAGNTSMQQMIEANEKAIEERIAADDR